jgi:hypothetical protein
MRYALEQVTAASQTTKTTLQAMKDLALRI